MRAAPRVLHVTTTDVSLTLLLGPQLHAFRAAGYEVLTASAPGPHADELRAQGFEHIPLRHTTRAMAPHRDALALLELHRVFRRTAPDIVHTHNPKPGVYGRLAARAARVPAVVNTQHGLYATPDDSWPRRTLVHTMERLAASCSDAELVQSSEDLATLTRLGVPTSKLHLLGNGIDLGRFDPSLVSTGTREAVRREVGAEPGDVVVGSVGRLVREKGFAEVFAAAKRLRADPEKVRFVVIGPSDTDKADALTEAELAAAQAAGVRLLGQRRDMVDLYAAMDIFVLASHREGFPRAAMEASAMGVPVIASDIRGCRQVVDDGETGILFPVRDVDALTAAVHTLAADPDRRASLGRAARQKAMESFDDRRVIDITLGVYEALRNRTSRKAAVSR